MTARTFPEDTPISDGWCKYIPEEPPEYLPEDLKDVLVRMRYTAGNDVVESFDYFAQSWGTYNSRRDGSNLRLAYQICDLLGRPLGTGSVSIIKACRALSMEVFGSYEDEFTAVARRVFSELHTELLQSAKAKETADEQSVLPRKSAGTKGRTPKVTS